MKKRQGNDLGIIWKINHAEPNPIERSVMQQVYIVHHKMRTRFAPVFAMEGDIIKFTYPAGNQEIGVYDLFVTFAFHDDAIPGGLGTCTVDLENAFEIVPRTAQEDVASDVITLQSELLLAIHGKSAYEIALKYGETRPEPEWLESLRLHFTDLESHEIELLQKPATDAAIEFRKKEEQWAIAESGRVEADKKRSQDTAQAITDVRRQGDTTRQQGLDAEEKGNAAAAQATYAKEQGDAALKKGNDAEVKGNTAKNQGDTAKQQGDTAQNQGNTAETKGNGAKEKGDKAEQQGNAAEQKGNTAEQQGKDAQIKGNAAQEQALLASSALANLKNIDGGTV